MLNHIVIMGRLTRDPEIKYTPNQVPVTSFTLAVDRDYSGSSGDKQVDFIDCVAWRNTAEFVHSYFSKGRMAVVSGRLQIRTWKDKNDSPRKSAEVVADNVYFGDSKKEGGGSVSSQPTSSQTLGGYSAEASYPSGDAGNGSSFADYQDDDGELPF